MELKELRDKLVEQRTLHQNALEASEKACKEIREQIQKLREPEVFELLKSIGIDISDIVDADLDDIRKSPEELEKYTKILDSVTSALYEHLKGELCLE